MSSWSLYIIRCKNNHLYTGISTDVERRFQEHQSNSPSGAKYLRGKGPLRLVFQTEVGNRSQASIAEAEVKKLSKIEKEALIKEKVTFEQIMQAKADKECS